MNSILSIGISVPEFKKKSVVSIAMGKEFGEVTNNDHTKQGNGW